MITYILVALIVLSGIAQSSISVVYLDRFTTFFGAVAAACSMASIADIPGIDRDTLAVISGLSMVVWGALTNKQPKR